MRLAVILILTLTAGVATAQPTPGHKLVEDAALGMPLPDDRDLLNRSGADAALTACLGKSAATGSALVWIELDRKGAVTSAKVRGSGVPALDTCLAAALKKATAAEKLPGPIVITGHLDLLDASKQDSRAFFASPRISTVAVMVDPHGAPWQLSAKRIGYTSNRASDISQAMDAQAAPIAACATRRGAKLATSNMLAWTDGKAIVRGSGDAIYDACLAKAFNAITLPAPDSGLWMELELRQAAEPLAPMGTTHDKAIRDALRDAVKTKKAALDVCFDKKPNAKLGTVRVALKDGKVSVKKIATGDAGVDACVKQTLDTVAVKNALATDVAELAITFD